MRNRMAMPNEVLETERGNFQGLDEEAAGCFGGIIRIVSLCARVNNTSILNDCEKWVSACVCHREAQVIKCVISATVNDLILQVAPSSNNKCVACIMDMGFTNGMYGNFVSNFFYKEFFLPMALDV